MMQSDVALCAQVGKKVMGGHLPVSYEAWQPDVDWSHMGLVVKAMAERGQYLKVDAWPDSHFGLHFGVHFVGTAETVREVLRIQRVDDIPRAVCLAALEAVGGDDADGVARCVSL